VDPADELKGSISSLPIGIILESPKSANLTTPDFE
jgi:hypothetical protein